MKLIITLFFIVLVVLIAIVSLFLGTGKNLSSKVIVEKNNNEGGLENQLHPLSIEYMRKQSANWQTSSDLAIEQELPDGVNYRQYIASYKSEGLKIYGLLTVPKGDPSVAPQDDNRKYPVIVFNHGYIPPGEYQTTERYVAYVNGFARNGYIVFKPDYRGHGNSEGQPLGAYYSPAYTIDVLNAVSTLKKYRNADPERIGMWGHSLGGNITLRVLVVSKDIKAAVLWAGVVGSYDDLLNRWRRRSPWSPSSREQTANRPSRQRFIEQYGTPEQNPKFWNSIDPTKFIQDIEAPIQLHHGTADESVPFEFSQKLKDLLEKEGKTVEYYTYLGADHNISSPSFEIAMQRSVEFFDKYLKEKK